MKKDTLVRINIMNMNDIILHGYVVSSKEGRVLVDVNGIIIDCAEETVTPVLSKRKRPEPFWFRPLFGSPAPWKRSFINALFVLALWLSFLAFAFHFLFISGLVLD